MVRGRVDRWRQALRALVLGSVLAVVVVVVVAMLFVDEDDED